MLRPTWDDDAQHFSARYSPFGQLVAKRIDVHVDVRGLGELTMQNDDTSLDPNKPFEPFGLRPSVGSRFRCSSRCSSDEAAVKTCGIRKT